MTDHLSYTIASSDAVIDSLQTLGKIETDAAEQDQRIYFDSFDWRLYQAGYLLWTQGRGRNQRLMLAERATALPVAMTPKPRNLGFGADLPEGRMREVLAPLLEMRRLLPVVSMHVECVRHRLLDGNDKTVVRLETERHWISDDGATPVPQPWQLALQPVRGYEHWLSDLRVLLDNQPEVSSAGQDLLSQALAAVGRRPADYSSQLDVRLEHGMRADHAAVQIHRLLLDTLKVNIPGTIEDLDSEFLHDFRVAVRRARSALSQIKGVFEPDDTARFAAELGWLGSVTGPTRDLDVFLLEYDKYRDSLPVLMRGDLGPFHEFLVRHQRKEQRALRRALRSERFDRFLIEWGAFLDQPRPAIVPLAPNGLRPVEEVASGRIWRMYRRVLREGRAIGPDSPADDLHDLRKSCKKLRYLVEFFRSLYPEEPVKVLVKSLKRLLDNLGEFQDLEVHAEHLRDYTHQMIREGEVPLETILAMGGLVTGLLQRQTDARNAFSERFSGFDTADNRNTYKALFKGVAEEVAA